MVLRQKTLLLKFHIYVIKKVPLHVILRKTLHVRRSPGLAMNMSMIANVDEYSHQ